MKHIYPLKLQIQRLISLTPDKPVRLKLHLNAAEINVLKTWFIVRKVMGITWEFKRSEVDDVHKY